MLQNWGKATDNQTLTLPSAYTNTIYHIGLSNGAYLECTANHPIMLKNGDYLKAEISTYEWLDKKFVKVNKIVEVGNFDAMFKEVK